MCAVPDRQKKVREGVRRVGVGPLGAHQLEQLGLLEAVFLEAMRLYPPAPSADGLQAAGVDFGRAYQFLDDVAGKSAGPRHGSGQMHCGRLVWRGTCEAE